MDTLSRTLLPIITIALLITNGFLIYQNLILKAQLEKPVRGQIKEGNTLTGFEAKDLNGNVAKINYDGSTDKTVLLSIFIQTVVGAKKQMPYWKELVSNADAGKFKVTAVTIDDNADAIKEYLNSYNANSWNVLSIKKEDADRANLSGTPATVVLDGKGKVEKVWVGMWRDKEIDDAGKYFNVNFTPVKTE